MFCEENTICSKVQRLFCAMSWEFLSTVAADVEWGRALEKLLSGESPSLTIRDILVPIRIL